MSVTEGAVYPVCVTAEPDPRTAKPTVLSDELADALWLTRDTYGIELKRDRLLASLTQLELKRFCEVLAPGGEWLPGEREEAKRLIGKAVPDVPVLTIEERHAQRAAELEQRAEEASGEPRTVDVPWADVFADLSAGRIVYADLATLTALCTFFATGRLDRGGAAAGVLRFDGCELVVSGGLSRIWDGMDQPFPAENFLSTRLVSTLGRLERAGWFVSQTAAGVTRIRLGPKLDPEQAASG